ncbi:hypothetical protein NMY22_g14244 [Coprinellus aureogranulatus]|nr:hypothetical protein NMY22_g14244 [Coprinellus aureogranulatus]
MPPYTDQEVRAASRSLVHAESDGLFKCVKACLVGAACTQTHIVHLAVHPGFEAAPRNIDLYVEVYLGSDPAATPGIRRLEEGRGSCIRKYPYDAARAQPFFWTIYHLPRVQQVALDVPRNRLYDTFKVRDSGDFGGQTQLFGNVLVVKSDRDGTVADVLERDLFFVERLVHRRGSPSGLPPNRQPSCDAGCGPRAMAGKGEGMGLDQQLACFFLTTTMSLFVPDRLHPMYNLDVLSRVMRYIPFDLLPPVLHWPEPAHRTVKPETRRRVWKKLKPYIPEASRVHFFPALSSSGGILFGDFVLQILLGVGEFAETYEGRRDLEIVVRHAHEYPIISFFEDMGYECQRVPTPNILQATVELVQELVKELEHETLRVKVYTSRSQAISVVVGHPYTAYWNAITENEIVVFCPRTTFANESLVCDWYTGERDDNLPFQILSDNEGWSTACGGECPMMLRKTFEDAGAAIYGWSPQKKEGESENWGEWGWGGSGWQWMTDNEKERHIRNSSFCLTKAIEWRVSRSCRSNCCHDGLLAAARRRYISTV